MRCDSSPSGRRFRWSRRARGRLPQAVETALYFTIAEGLTNVAKYAEAAKARVTVDAGEGNRHGRDRGRRPWWCGRRSGGSGLRGLADRLEAIGGSLEVDSAAGAGAGTVVRARADGEPAACSHGAMASSMSTLAQAAVLHALRYSDRVCRIGATASITGWLQDLPLAGLALIVFAATFLAAAAIYAVVMVLAVGARGQAFKAFSPGMLPPWGCSPSSSVPRGAGMERRRASAEAVNREASALRSVVLLARVFPGEPETRMDTLVDRHHTGRRPTRNGRRWPTSVRR